MRQVLDYLWNHWQGKQSLARSFWVNLVALRIVLFLLQDLLSPAEGTNWSQSAWPFMAWAVFAHGVVLIWQIVGVLRAAETHFRDNGSLATGWGAQIALVPALFLSGIYLLQAWQQSRPAPTVENFLERMERERAANYTMRIIPGILAIEYTGTIELGATRKLEGILNNGIPVRTVILNSIGGNIYEARGLAKLISEKGLNTHVADSCTSACTSVFLAGARRTITPTGRLGFHQYRMDASYDILKIDPVAEQEKDLGFFAAQGVSEAFLAQVFSQPSNSMWFPTTDELLEANVVQQILGK